MSANWPIRVGGIYLLTGREPLALSVRALDGDIVHYIHVRDGAEFCIGDMTASCFRSMCQPDDQSPLPELLEALDPDALEAIAAEIGQEFRHSARADSLRYIARIQREAIAKAVSQ